MSFSKISIKNKTYINSPPPPPPRVDHASYLGPIGARQLRWHLVAILIIPITALVRRRRRENIVVVLLVRRLIWEGRHAAEGAGRAADAADTPAARAACTHSKVKSSRN